MNLESARINKNDSEKQNLHDKVEEIKLKKISDSVHEKEMKKMNVLRMNVLIGKFIEMKF